MRGLRPLRACPRRWRETVETVLRQRLSAHEHPEAVADALEVVPRSRPFEEHRELAEIAVADGRRRPAATRPTPAIRSRWANATRRRSPARGSLVEDAGPPPRSPIAWQGGQLSKALAELAAAALTAEALAPRRALSGVRDSVRAYASVREWDGESYDRISATDGGARAARCSTRLELDGDETVLDAGCGSGRVTEALIERLPRGRVIAVDASASMVAGRAASGSGRGAPGRARQLDLLELELEEPVDAILSTATFHWIADHERLFARLRAALRAGRAGWWRSAGGRATSTCCAARRTRCSRANPTPSTSATGSRRGTTPGRGRRASACSARASPPPSAGCTPAPQRARAPARVPLDDRARPARAAAARRSCASRSWTTCSAELGEPVVVDYVRLNIDATPEP